MFSVINHNINTMKQNTQNNGSAMQHQESAKDLETQIDLKSQDGSADLADYLEYIAT